MDISKAIKNNRLVLFSIMSFIVTGILSQGFMHPDEHYQILELLNIKFSGPHQDLSILNWDFHYKMRSWLQPFLYYTSFFYLKNINPFTLSMLIRLTNGLIGFYAIYNLAKITFPDKWKKVLLLTSYTWFVPYLMVRTSSESLATSFFILAYCLYRKKKLLYAAAFFGITFLIRFQMAVLIAPLMIISLYYKEISIKSFFGMLFFIIVIIALGAIIDYWGYGEWTMSSYNYLYYNLIEGRSKDFGTEAVYYYLYKPLAIGVPLISIPLLINYFSHTWKSKDKSLALSLLIFIVINSLIAHKEVRFLTPVYILVSIYAVKEMLCGKNWSRYIAVYLVFNLLVMTKTSLMPAHSRVLLYKEIYKRNMKTLFTIKEVDKFKFTMPFYMRGAIEVKSEEKVNSLGKYPLLTTNHSEFLIADKRKNCKLVYTQYPSWIKRINITDWLSRSSYFSIWNCSEIREVSLRHF